MFKDFNTLMDFAKTYQSLTNSEKRALNQVYMDGENVSSLTAAAALNALSVLDFKFQDEEGLASEVFESLVEVQHAMFDRTES
jgi:hypothetical protein